MKNYNYTPIFLFTFILLTQSVSAFEFTLKEAETIKNAEYQTDYATFKSAITYTGTFCKITCEYFAGSDYGKLEDIKSETRPFSFNINAEPDKGNTSGTLKVICNMPAAYCIDGPEEETKPYSFSHPYLGDKKCTTNYEDCTSAKSDCPCITTGTECIDTLDSGKGSGRDPDDRKCVTYCGNEIVESNYENCTTCPDDVGKCDRASCIKGSECEGKYCVHERCWNKPYREEDGFCDLDFEENCKNSPEDCKCGNYQRCESGICKTWCGNNNCEESEQGICKEDCDWCGDGECAKGETCKTCPNDCGVCEEKDEEIIQQTREIVKKATKETEQKTFRGLLGTAGVLILLIVSYIIYKFIKEKKKKPKVRKKKTKNNKK